MQLSRRGFVSALLPTLLLGLASIAAPEATRSPCDESLSAYAGGNLFELAEGALACVDEGREDDAAFLSLLTRIRLSADFLLLGPQDMTEVMQNEALRDLFTDQGE